MAQTLNELKSMLKAIGWKLDNIKPPTKTSGRYVAKGTGPAGQKGERDGKTPEQAIGNLLVFAQHHNAIRSFAAIAPKLSAWNTTWSTQMPDIAKAYSDMPVYDGKSEDAYRALANEEKMQADAIRQQVNVNVTDDPEPYENHAAMMHDIHHKGNYIVSRAHADHPLWSTEQVVNHRICHDMAHAQSGGDHSWDGEVRAAHVQMARHSPLARRALFTETLGQSAYALHHGGHANGPQKIGMLPQFVDPMEKMNGEEVHVPHGKLIYPENIMPADASWGWSRNPTTNTWEQNQSAIPGQNQAVSSFKTAAGLQVPGAIPYAPPHHQTPLEYPDRAAYASIEPSDEYPDILPNTAADPNMYAHSKVVAPLVQPGSSDDYVDKQAVENNVNKFDQPEDPFIAMTPERQRQIIRNAFSVVMLSPRKDLKGNAQQYQAIADLPSDASLGDIFHRVLSSRNYHNYYTVGPGTSGADPTDLGSEHGMMGMTRPTYEKQLNTLHQYIKQQNPDVSDAQAWENTKSTMAAMYKQIEPHAEAAIEAEGGTINTMRVRLKIIEMANTWLESILSGPRDWHKPGDSEGLLGPETTTQRRPGMIPTDLPGIPVQSRTAAPKEKSEDARYSGVVYGHLEGIAELTADQLEIMRQYAVKDITEDNGRGFIFRAGCTAMNIRGIGPKTASFAWLLIVPHSSELGIIDTHAARGLGFEDNAPAQDKHYYALERAQRTLKDSSGYGDMPLGKFHWGMWDLMRTPGSVSDHRALRPHNFLPWDHPDMEHGSDLLNPPIARDQVPIWLGPDRVRQVRPQLEKTLDEYYDEVGGKGTRPYSHYRQGLTPDRPEDQQPSTWQPTAKTIKFGNVPPWLEQKPDGTWGAKDEAVNPFQTPWPDVRSAGWHESGLDEWKEAGQRGDLPENIDFRWNDPMEATELTAWVAGQKVGIIQIEPANETVKNIGVPDGWRRRGIATALFNEAKIAWPDLQHSSAPNSLSDDAQGWVGVHDPEHLEAYQQGQRRNPFATSSWHEAGADNCIYCGSRLQASADHPTWKVCPNCEPNMKSLPDPRGRPSVPGAKTTGYHDPTTSPHGGYGNTGDVVCSGCGHRVYTGEPLNNPNCPNCGKRFDREDETIRGGFNNEMGDRIGRAPWEDMAEDPDLKRFNPAQYMEEARGNITAAQKLMALDLAQAKGMSPEAAHLIAGQLLDNHQRAEAEWHPEGVGNTDMSEFENRPTTDPEHALPGHDDWGPSEEFPDDFNPHAEQSVWDRDEWNGFIPHPTRPLAYVNPETEEQREFPDQETHDAYFAGEETPHNKMPQFPEPTGDTVPPNPGFRSPQEEEYYRSAATDWLPKPIPAKYHAPGCQCGRHDDQYELEDEEKTSAWHESVVPRPGIDEPGLPRPFRDEMPVPWSGEVKDYGGDIGKVPLWGKADETRLHTPDCLVCGNPLDEKYVVFRTHEGEPNAEGGYAIDGGMHPNCAKMTAQFCPHLKNDPKWEPITVSNQDFKYPQSAPGGGLHPGAGEPFPMKGRPQTQSSVRLSHDDMLVEFRAAVQKAHDQKD